MFLEYKENVEFPSRYSSFLLTIHVLASQYGLLGLAHGIELRKVERVYHGDLKEYRALPLRCPSYR